MQTRKDLYQAHRLMVRRMAAALIQGEPDTLESPLRRYNLATLVGVIAGVLAIGVVVIIGLINPGGAKGLRDPGLVIVEEDTGATYVYSKKERRLIPVLNYASARLIADGQPERRSVSTASLAGFERGPMVGIPGAPESLPEPEDLVRSPWAACIQDAPVAGGGRRPYVSLVGGRHVGERPISHGLLVSDEETVWLLWQGRKFQVPAANVRVLSDLEPRKVAGSWLNAFPTGSDVRAWGVEGMGEKRGEAKVGQVLREVDATGRGERWYVLLRDGIAPITPAQAVLMLKDPATKKAYDGTPEPIALDAVGERSRSKTRVTADLPARLPTIADSSDTLCAVFPDPAKGPAQPRLMADSLLSPPPTVRTDHDGGSADRVVLAAGRAALVGVLPGPGKVGEINAYVLITERGRAYAVPTRDAMSKLGYEVKHAVPVPTNLVKLVPAGPSLDPGLARRPATG